jgi:hypothetical protein
MHIGKAVVPRATVPVMQDSKNRTFVITVEMNATKNVDNLAMLFILL